MTAAIRFRFRSVEERDEFLELNDLRLLRGDGRIVDHEGHPVGRLGDGASLVEIKHACFNGLRPRAWWRAGC